ncbi:hypothetical protein [Streptomyces sp. NPDC048002]|uniref:hypothetical protein n=1 Tax=unclassified Streptomyces TaxID=2593676 RepID=UPI0033E8567B
MTDVVDSGELLRRIQRARDGARRDEQAWRARSVELRSGDPQGAQDAAVRTIAFETVLKVLDEILTPGRHTDELAAGAEVNQVT